jgi:hypothetical protein
LGETGVGGEKIIKNEKLKMKNFDLRLGENLSRDSGSFRNGESGTLSGEESHGILTTDFTDFFYRIKGISPLEFAHPPRDGS